MNARVDSHAVVIRPPYFGDGSGAQLHRYLDAEFIPLFQRELQRNNFDHGWRNEDRFSDHDDSLVLRLPMHRSFYLVSCEVSCDRPGMPALDPARITSAGFVIRRLRDGGEHSWMLEDDIALGWQDTPTGLRDPDLDRRVCANNVLHPRNPVPAYSGEQTHPLHVHTAYDAKGKRHTVLYGFIPLGGTYTPRTTADVSPFDPASVDLFKGEGAKHLPWPYGYRVPGDTGWRSEYSRPIAGGRPDKATFELLRLLVNRYHLGEAGIADNAALEKLAASIHFHDESKAGGRLSPGAFTDHSRQHFRASRRLTLLQYLRAHFKDAPNRLVDWIQSQESAIDQAGGLDNLAQLDRLPMAAGDGKLQYSLYLTAADAQQFRDLLGQRLLDQARSAVQAMPLPKFGQGPADVYQIVPFLRARDERGKERIYWATLEQRSETFRVAAPFDPHASRPSMIQMPALSDLRKGLAKGASMITPADTFSLLNALNLKKGASEDVLPKDEAPQLGIQWICSFSLPVITLVAMILLMIMISLLNIIFFWLPWVKICLPFPKIK